MDDKCNSADRSTLEPLALQDLGNVTKVKAKLNRIIALGKDYEYEIYECLKALLQSSDQEVLILTMQAISELVKCELKREIYAQKDIIEPILLSLNVVVTLDTLELIKQCCRALGNLCCDCDTSRKIMLEQNIILTLIKVLKTTLEDSYLPLNEIKLLTCKVLLNFVIGGQEYSEPFINEGIIEIIRKILIFESKKEYMDENVVVTVLIILNVINYNDPEILFEDEVNLAVLNVLKEATIVEVSDLCLDHFHTQTEHDSVKTLLAKKGGLQLVCRRLEQLVDKEISSDVTNDNEEVEKCLKKACDLIVIVLMGDEAMNLLYDNGKGEIYKIMEKWLDSKNYHLLITGVLAMGNFARQDDHCVQMMENKTFDKLLDLFEHHHKLSLKTEEQIEPLDKVTVNKIEDGALSAVRNLLVPVANKKVVAEQDRAAPLLINALPLVENHTVAYKLMASLRMLIDGQECVACAVLTDPRAVRALARWGGDGHARAAAEGTRLMARAAVQVPAVCRTQLLQAEGCVSSLVNMMVSPHSIMQNEAILTLTLLAIDALPAAREQEALVRQLLDAEVGKHVAVLIETNCAKPFLNCVENLIAFLDVTSKNNSILLDYKEAKVHESLQKLAAKTELSEKLTVCSNHIISIISCDESD